MENASKKNTPSTADASRACVVLVMGVAGSGKTTVGRRVAERLDWAFLEGDRFHSKANVAKMASGEPLTDEDRWPWLAAMHAALAQHQAEGRSAVLACSALKASYRARLLNDLDNTQIVYLKGDFDLINQRMQARQGHYMKASMLESQFNILEEPDDAWNVDVALPVDTLVETVLDQLACIPTKN